MSSPLEGLGFPPLSVSTFSLNSHGDVTTTIVFGEVVTFHIAKAVASYSPNTGKLIVDSGECACIVNDSVDNFTDTYVIHTVFLHAGKLKPMCRLGGNTYAHISSFFDISRPDKFGNYK